MDVGGSVTGSTDVALLSYFLLSPVTALRRAVIREPVPDVG